MLGLVALGHGANLLVFVAGGLRRGAPPLVAPGDVAPPVGHADPIPQALVLTAIVIGFAVVAFAAVLVVRVCQVTGTDDLDQMREETAGELDLVAREHAEREHAERDHVARDHAAREDTA